VVTREGSRPASAEQRLKELGGKLPAPPASPRRPKRDSYDIAVAAHKSEAYQKTLQALGSGAERDYRIVEGI